MKHFTTQHQGQFFKCGFFVRLCSRPVMVSLNMNDPHQYLRHRCDLCGHRTQFPYQMKVHYRVHSGEGLVKCDLCDHKFACKSSKITHQNTHTTKLLCDQCKPGTSKVYTSTNSLRIHVHGKHGKGWTAPCGAHFVWKSKYTCHITVDQYQVSQNLCSS